MKECWDDNNVIEQAHIIEFSRIRDLEELEEAAALAGAKSL